MMSPRNSTPLSMEWASYPTDLGRGWIGWSGGAVAEMVLPGGPVPAAAGVPPAEIAELGAALTDYFAGRGRLPVVPDAVERGATTDFEREVYRVVTAIPAGSTLTYAEVAERAGRPGAARAVGAAMAKNLFAPVIPCHRVVGSDGSLRGYAGGIEMKAALLEMEAGDA